MASIFDVAGYIILNRDHTTAWQLEKLCYYSKAWSLALNDTAIFRERFGARPNGPVCSKLYETHKGMRDIPKDLFSYKEGALTDCERAVIHAVLDKYGDMSGDELSKLTHSEAPWKYARRGLPDDNPGRRRIISEKVMRDYYISSREDYMDMEDKLVLYLSIEREKKNNSFVTYEKAMESFGITIDDIISAGDIRIE